MIVLTFPNALDHDSIDYLTNLGNTSLTVELVNMVSIVVYECKNRV